MYNNNKIRLCAAALAVGALVETARAVPVVSFTATSGSTVSIGDNLPGDTDPTVGSIDWKGTIGGWTVNVLEGTTYGVGETMDVTFKATSSSSVLLAPLTLTFKETGVNLAGPVDASIGGTTSKGSIASGTVEYKVFGSGLIYDSGALTGVSFSKDSGLVPSGNFSQFIQQIIITDGKKGQVTSGDAIVNATAVPDGGCTVGLFGLGMLGIEALRRRLK